MAYSECLPTRLNPLAERTCFSQVVNEGPGPAEVSLMFSFAGDADGEVRKMPSWPGTWANFSPL